MKRTFRLLYSIFLLVFAAAILTIRVMFQQNGSFQLRMRYDIRFFKHDPEPVTNATLMKYASIDIGDPKLMQEVDELLMGSVRNLRTPENSIWSSGKCHSPESHRLCLIFKSCLNDWWRKRKFDQDVMTDLVHTVKFSIDENKGEKMGLTSKYKSCAVVGNSGILLKSDHGPLIDSHEAVIRLNNAWTRGFERKVGSKTTISFVNSNVLHLCARRTGCFCHPYGMNVSIVMYMCQPAQFFDYLVCNSLHKVPIIVTDPRFDVVCGRIVKYYSLKRFVKMGGNEIKEWEKKHDGDDFHYSSGMQAVMLAVGICDKVSIFGFGKSESSSHHYHTHQTAELSLHDYEAEYDLYDDLMKRPEVIPFVPDKYKFPPVVIYH